MRKLRHREISYPKSHSKARTGPVYSELECEQETATLLATPPHSSGVGAHNGHSGLGTTAVLRMIDCPGSKVKIS